VWPRRWVKPEAGNDPIAFCRKDIDGEYGTYFAKRQYALLNGNMAFGQGHGHGLSLRRASQPPGLEARSPCCRAPSGTSLWYIAC
jgi:hypothetical protein